MRILFLDLSTHLNSLDDFQTRARGGRVGSLRLVPDALSQLGHEVWVLSDIKAGGMTPTGVRWLQANENLPSINVLVLNRGIGKGYAAIDAQRRVLWTHDLPHNGFAPEPKVFSAIDLTVFMSRYGEAVWRCFYRDIRKSVRIPNGVDRDLFRPLEKDLNYLIFASAPNRGLRRLPLIADAIQSRVGRKITFKAFSNLAVLHPGEKSEEDQQAKDGFGLPYMSEAVVQVYDPIPQEQLAVELGRAGLMIIPTDYPEICSNIVLQSLSCGTPIITTGGIGSASEWIRHGRGGLLTRWTPADYMVYQVEVVRNAVALLENENMHRSMIRMATKAPELNSWEAIGRRWEKALKKLF